MGNATSASSQVHIVKDFPCKKVSGRDFSMTDEEVKCDPSIGASNVLISNFKVNVLFDSGSSNSFLSQSLVNKLEIMHVCVNEIFSVIIPSSEEMSSN